MSQAPWADWKGGPAPLGDVLDRVIYLLGTVPDNVRTKIVGAMEAAKFEVVLTADHKQKPEEVGATIAMTVPSNGDMPTALMPILLVLGYPQVMPSSITPLAFDRMRAFWEFGKAPVHGELAYERSMHNAV